MRVAIIHFLKNRSHAEELILDNLKKASAARGNEVILVDGLEDEAGTRLAMFDYLAVLIRPEGVLSARVPDTVMKRIRGSGSLSGKKGCALVIKGGFRSAKLCRNLMADLESAGLRLDYFDSIRDAAHASAVGTNVG